MAGKKKSELLDHIGKLETELQALKDRLAETAEEPPEPDIIEDAPAEPEPEDLPGDFAIDELPIDLGLSHLTEIWSLADETAETKEDPPELPGGGEVTKQDVAVTGTAPRRFHSVTRKRCQLTLVRRKIVLQPQISSAGLTVGRTEPGPKISGIVRIKALFRRTITTTLKLKIATQWHTVTGLPIPVAVSGEGEVSSQIIQSMEASLETITDLFIQPWITIVTGEISGRLVVHITDTYEWQGPDCEAMGIRPNPTSYTSTLYGPWVTKPIQPLYFIDYEFGTSSVTVRGRKWAREEARRQFQDFLKGLGSSEFVRTLPLPANMPGGTP